MGEWKRLMGRGCGSVVESGGERRWESGRVWWGEEVGEIYGESMWECGRVWWGEEVRE